MNRISGGFERQKSEAKSNQPGEIRMHVIQSSIPQSAVSVHALPLPCPHRRVQAAMLVLCTLGALPLAQAGEEDIDTDRPDFVESPRVVGKGYFQIETSVARQTSRNDGVKTTITSTPTLFRFGIHDHWEARVETDGRLWGRAESRGVTVTANGWADTSLGLKWQLQKGDETSGKPGIGLLFHADLDSGSSQYRGNGVRPSIRGVAEFEFAAEVALGIMPGLVFDKNAQDQRFTAGLLGIVLSKGWSEQWRSFVELSLPQIASAKNGGNIATLDAGAAYLLNKHTQIDFAVSRGLNKNTPDWSLGAGFSIKF